MKFKFLLPLSPVLLVVALQLFLGCNRLPPSFAPPIPPQVIWSNGTIGTWFGSIETPSTVPGCSTTAATVAVTDSISGNTSTLQLSTTKACGNFYYQGAPANPFIYYSSGHLQFDIRLEQPTANFTAIGVAYVINSGSGNYAQYNFTVGFINSLSTISFTHVSVPFTSFTVGNGYNQTSIDTPFQISWSTVSASSGAVVTIDNIVWTAN